VTAFYGHIWDKYGLTPDQVVHAASICSDDINSAEYPAQARKMIGPFTLGGLDGLPFTGLTGMGAFEHHVPDGGGILIFFGPHIGVSEKAPLGKIFRLHQSEASDCCGAAAKALTNLRKGIPQRPSKFGEDYQQEQLEKLLFEQRDRILAAGDCEHQMKEATDVIYENMQRMVWDLFGQTPIPLACKHIFVVGGILINTDDSQANTHDKQLFIDVRTALHIEPMKDTFRTIISKF